jgi:hypothetical protein
MVKLQNEKSMAGASEWGRGSADGVAEQSQGM